MSSQKKKQSDVRENAATTKKHWVRLTRVCNNNCSFCLDKEAQDGTVLPIGEIKEDLLSGRKKGIDKVVLSGGEATIHPKFLDIVKEAKELGYGHIQVITNGRMFVYPDFLLSAVKNGLKEITFSLHGHNAELHDFQTQIKGSFAQALSGLKNALSIEGLIVSVDIVISRLNYKYLADIIRFFIDLGVTEFDLLQIIPFGQSWENRGELFYDIEEALPYIRKALEFSKKKGIFIWTNRFPPQYLEGFEDLIQHPFKLNDEISGRKDMFERFLKKGRIMECRGERCQHCFLNNFCKDLVEFNTAGQLDAKNPPFCSKSSISAAPLRALKKSPEIDIFKFLEFFISCRYFIKGQKCEICDLNKHCSGAHINYIRKYGFDALKPKLTKIKNAHLNLNKFSRCALNCIFCSASLSSPGKKDLNSLDSDLIKVRLSEARRCLKPKKLYIGGNDPLDYPDIVGLLKHAKKIGFKKISMASTGLKLSDKKFVNAIVGAGIDAFELPIYGHNRELHDLITGRRGSFEKLLKACANLKKYPKVKVYLHTLLLKQNYLKIFELYNFAINNLIQNDFEFRLVRPRNDDLKDYRRVCPPFSEIKKILQNSPPMPKSAFAVPFCVLPEYYIKNMLIAKRKNQFLRTALQRKNGQLFQERVARISFKGVMVEDEGFSKSTFGNHKVEELHKLSNCAKCKTFEFCRGIPMQYIILYGDKEFNPLEAISQE